MNSKKLIFGLGSGRCGTHSLADLLNSQKDSQITHEMGDQPVLTWEFDEKTLDYYLNKITSRNSFFAGDVAFYLLPYVETIIKKYPESRFVCLMRDKEETVCSYEKKTIGRNHWQTHRGEFYQLCPWDKCYPKYECKNKRTALELYYDDYYSFVDSLVKKYPSNVSLFPMDSLNDEKEVKSILKFIDVPEKDAIIKPSSNIKARNN